MDYEKTIARTFTSRSLNRILDIIIYTDLTYELTCVTSLDSVVSLGKAHKDVLNGNWEFVRNGEYGRLKTEDGGLFIAVIENQNLDTSLGVFSSGLVICILAFVFAILSKK